jgi:Ca2+-binding RTX toxin-like protein
MGRDGLQTLAGALALAALMAVPAGASAATAAVSGGTFAYSAGPGEGNDAGVFFNPGGVAVLDTAPIATGPGCVPAAPVGTRRRAICRLPAERRRAVIALGDGDDALTMRAEMFPPVEYVDSAFVDGGSGNDALEAFHSIGGPVTLRGGGGDDYLRGTGPQYTASGGDGNDVIFVRAVIVLNATTKAAELFGGRGNDTIAVPAAQPLGVPPRSNEHLRGDSGDDLLFGNDGADRLDGGSGADRLGSFRRTVLKRRLARSRNARAKRSPVFAAARYREVGGDALFGAAGNDWLAGDIGDDVLVGGGGRDRLAGGRDADLLAGGADRDRLAGDAGDDLLYGGAGSDSLHGGSGRDTLVTADDKRRDALAACGRGARDRLVAGLADVSRKLTRTRRFRVTGLPQPGQLPPPGFEVTPAALAAVSFPAVGTRVTGCERLALAPVSLLKRK